MKHALIVGLGGFVGSMGRYWLGSYILHKTTDWRFPLGTFMVNVIGCFVIGMLAGFAEKYSWFSQEWRLLLITGLCGGFTTFSAFAYENIFLLRRGEVFVAGLYITLSVMVCLLATWAAFKLVSTPASTLP